MNNSAYYYGKSQEHESINKIVKDSITLKIEAGQ